MSCPACSTLLLYPHPTGCLSLELSPLKTSLRAEAGTWKVQFAANLHRQCAEDLRNFDTYIR